jgi:hypothetical protein
VAGRRSGRLAGTLRAPRHLSGYGTGRTPRTTPSNEPLNPAPGASTAPGAGHIHGRRGPLAEAGLLRYPLLGPTRAARRHVRELRRTHPLPAGRRGPTHRDRPLAVVLHGEPALRLLVPRFALRAGLVHRVEVGGDPFLKRSPRGTGGGYGGYSSCGGGGGGGE